MDLHARSDTKYMVRLVFQFKSDARVRLTIKLSVELNPRQ